MKYLLFISILLSLVCCKKQPEKETEYIPFVIPCSPSNNLDTVRLLFNGTWKFVQEKRVNRIQGNFTYITPQSQGYQASFKLDNDTLVNLKNNFTESKFKFKILKQADITGTYNPDDNEPVLVQYDLQTGQRINFVPIKICDDYLILQFQSVTSIGGEQLWKKL